MHNMAQMLLCCHLSFLLSYGVYLKLEIIELMEGVTETQHGHCLQHHCEFLSSYVNLFYRWISVDNVHSTVTYSVLSRFLLRPNTREIKQITTKLGHTITGNVSWMLVICRGLDLA
jgi:hypothetical protein